jgi:hypothetical protein
MEGREGVRKRERPVIARSFKRRKKNEGRRRNRKKNEGRRRKGK